MISENPGLIHIQTGLTTQRIFHTWWPLAVSWILMSSELPALSAVIARLANPEVNLAAYGGIVFPMALVIESPIIMLLSASTALCKDYASYRRLFRFMMLAGAGLTLVHVLIAFTPAYYVVARQLIGLPENVVEPGRLGLMLITPWTWSIAFRRFQQGVLIRFGHSRAVGIGTVVRLTSVVIVLTIGYMVGSLPGVAVGALAQSAGVLSEAIYAGWRVRPVLRFSLPSHPALEPISWRSFAHFYAPLALTALLGLVWQPLGSAALSRMPEPLMSLAVWPVISGLTMVFRSFGMAVNEVVVALLDAKGSYRVLRKFIFLLASVVIGLQLLSLITPVAKIYFSVVSALSPNLADLAWMAFWLAVPMSAISVFQNWFQGTIVNSRKTRAIPEATTIFLGTFLAIALIGILVARIPGLFVGMFGFISANLAQASWLWVRSRGRMDILRKRDLT